MLTHLAESLAHLRRGFGSGRSLEESRRDAQQCPRPAPVRVPVPCSRQRPRLRPRARAASRVRSFSSGSRRRQPRRRVRSQVPGGSRRGEVARLHRLVPRNRDARIAVLGSSVQRAAAYGQSTARSRALKRRIVVAALVLASLALLTVLVPPRASLDPLEGYGASALRPFEIAANRVARPFRDASGWAQGLFAAKAENRRLVRENELLRQQNAALTGAEQENTALQQLLHYVHSPSFPGGYDEVAAEVLTSPTAPSWDQSVTISAGSDQGIVPEDVVVTGQGLVGIVAKVLPTGGARHAHHQPGQRGARRRRGQSGGDRNSEAGRGRRLADPRPHSRKDLRVDYRDVDHHGRLAGRRQAALAVPP